MQLPFRRALSLVFAVFAVSLALRAPVLGEDRFQAPSQGDVIAAGTFVEVRWTEQPGALEQELVLSLDGGLTFSIRLTPEMSPRTRAYRWSVPNVASAHARVALRSGAGEGSEEETLRLVSGDFSIVPSGADDAGELLRGATEWWTRQALFSPLAEDPLAEEIGHTVQAVLSEDWLEAGEPDTTGPPGVSPFSARCLPTFHASRRLVAAACALRTGGPLPLRL